MVDVENVWSILAERRLTLQELHRRTRLAPGYLSELFAGKKNARLQTVLKLIDAGLPAEPLVRALVHAREVELGKRGVGEVLSRYSR